MELIPLTPLILLLFACSMARGQEEISTSQAGRRRGPSLNTPYASSLISSLSMEELRSYYQIPNNIDFELSDDPTKSIVNEEDIVAYFTGGTARSWASLPHFISGKAVPTLLWSASCSYPSECHSDPDRMQRVEPPIPTGHFFL